MNSYDPDEAIFALVLMSVVSLVAGTWYGRSAMGLRFGRALLFGFGTTLASTVTTRMIEHQQRQTGLPNFRGLRGNDGVRSMFADAAIFLALLLAAQLWQRWLGARPAVNAPAAESIVWLTPGQGILASLLAASAYWGWGWSFLGILVLALLALVAHPLYHHKLAHPPPPRAEPEPVNSGEREKVLAMLDAGRITVTESAELLSALAASAPAPTAAGPATAFGGPRRLLLAGAALVLVGFFLPWFSFNPGEQVQSMMSRMSPGGLIPNLPQVTMNTVSVQVEGGDIGHGLGLWILGLALGSAVLPFVLPELAERSWRRLAGLALGAGGIMLVYLLHDAIHLVSVGLVVVFVGYGLEAAGVVQSGRKAA